MQQPRGAETLYLPARGPARFRNLLGLECERRKRRVVPEEPCVVEVLELVAARPVNQPALPGPQDYSLFLAHLAHAGFEAPLSGERASARAFPQIREFLRGVALRQ